MNEALIRRLETLERDNRRWKILGVILIVVLGLLASLGAQRIPTGAPLDEIRSQRFVLVNANGEEQGHLNARTDGKVEMALFGSDKNTALLELDGSKTGFMLSGGNNLIGMTVSTSEAGIWLDGAFGRGVLYLSPDGPSVTLLGDDKKTKIWSVSSKEKAQSGRTWVLWATMGRAEQAKGAWFSKGDCEEERTFHISRLKEEDLRVELVCLPEGIEPQGER